MINIKPVRHESFGCFEGIIASIAKHFNHDFRLMFINSWGFVFNNSDDFDVDTIGERLDIGRNNTEEYNFIQVLHKYHGIILNAHDNLDSNQVKLLAESEIALGYPLAIHLDTFLCPWSIAYQKYHIEHYILIIGISQEDESYVCIDPYSIDHIDKIKTSKIGIVTKKCYSFRLEQQKEKCNWISVLSEIYAINYSNQNNERMFEMMTLFCEALKNINLHLERNGATDLYIVPLLRKIKSIGSSRINFARALRFIIENSEETKFSEIEDALINVAGLWGKVRLLLIKLMMSDNYEKKTLKVASIMENIILEESEIISKMNNLIYQKS